MISIPIVVLILANIGDHFDLVDGDYAWCRRWWEYLAQYLTNLFYAYVTQPLNAILAGHPDHSLSGRCGHNKGQAWYWAWGYYLIGLLFFPAKMDIHHCRRHAHAINV